VIVRLLELSDNYAQVSDRYYVKRYDDETICKRTSWSERQRLINFGCPTVTKWHYAQNGRPPAWLNLLLRQRIFGGLGQIVESGCLPH